MSPSTVRAQGRGPCLWLRHPPRWDASQERLRQTKRRFCASSPFLPGLLCGSRDEEGGQVPPSDDTAFERAEAYADAMTPEAAMTYMPPRSPPSRVRYAARSCRVLVEREYLPNTGPGGAADALGACRSFGWSACLGSRHSPGTSGWWGMKAPVRAADIGGAHRWGRGDAVLFEREAIDDDAKRRPRRRRARHCLRDPQRRALRVARHRGDRRFCYAGWGRHRTVVGPRDIGAAGLVATASPAAAVLIANILATTPTRAPWPDGAAALELQNHRALGARRGSLVTACGLRPSHLYGRPTSSMEW